MKILQFKCTLLTDVVLNMRAATEGNQNTLDFVPGNCFLGIVAGNGQYDSFGENQLEVFHSGKVRFGDAHPAFKKERTLRVPASMYYPKLVGKERLYIHHLYKREEDKLGTGGMPQQLKQCRTGFYAFTENDKCGHEVKVLKTFALKSAYDREQRRSEDSQMYGYESINKGCVLYFSVEVDNDTLAEKIETSLVGKRHIGKSRTAQYGLVNIESETFYQNEGQSKGSNGLITVYADSRLIFLDDNGQPTFRPTPEQLGIGDTTAVIDWGKTQVRTFQYAPWNGKRQTYDTDRCGIEKGSVFVIRTNNDAPAASSWVGHYLNEGFGHVIYNPSFLNSKPGSNGMAEYCLKDQEEPPKNKNVIRNNNELFKFLERKQKDVEVNALIYKKVNEFVDKNGPLFKGDKFASQWGTIRSIAMRYPQTNDLKNELFDKKKRVQRSRDGIPYQKDTNDAYLTHGIAAKKWTNKRIIAFKDFIKFFESYENGNYTQQAVINLAAEMGKIA